MEYGWNLWTLCLKIVFRIFHRGEVFSKFLNKNGFVSTWRDFTKNFLVNVHMIVETLSQIFHPYSILSWYTTVKFLINCVLTEPSRALQPKGAQWFPKVGLFVVHHWKFGIFENACRGVMRSKSQCVFWLMVWTTKSPIRENHWVPNRL